MTYEDYFDFTIEFGLDPYLFKSFNAWWKHVLKKFPVMSWGAFSDAAKRRFKAGLHEIWEERRPERKKPLKQRIREIEERKPIRYAVRKATRVQARAHKRKGTKPTATQKKTWRSIERKAVQQKKYSKIERKELQSAKMNRVWELRKQFGYSMKNAWSRVRQETEGL